MILLNRMQSGTIRILHHLRRRFRLQWRRWRNILLVESRREVGCFHLPPLGFDVFSPVRGRGFGGWFCVVVEALGLEEKMRVAATEGGGGAKKYLKQYAVVGDVSPEMGHRITAMAATRLDFQDAVAVQVGTHLA